MDDRWESYASALQSSDSDRVNAVIDEIKDMDLDERIRLFDVCFDDLTDLYAESNDECVRQSTVRVADQLTPDIALVFGPGVLTDGDGPVAHADREYIHRSEMIAASEAIRSAVETLLS